MVDIFKYALFKIHLGTGVHLVIGFSVDSFTLQLEQMLWYLPKKLKSTLLLCELKHTLSDSGLSPVF